MPGEGIGEEAVLLLRTGSDVVDDERRSVSRLAIAHDHDMRKASRDQAGHEVSGLVVGRLLRHRKRPALALEEALQVRNAPMVDVAVGRLESPVLRVGVEVSLHVLVDEPLQIAPLRIAHRTDHHIDADALFARNVPVRIGELLIGRHIAHRHADLRTGRRDEREVVRRSEGCTDRQRHGCC